MENDTDMTLAEAFTIMDMDVDGEQGTESETKAQADGRVEAKGQVKAEGWTEEKGQKDKVDLVLIEANIGATKVHMAGATLEELYKQHDEKVVGYKARISFLESRVATVTVKEDDSSGSGPIVSRNEYL